MSDDLEAQIAEVLGEHFVMWHDLPDGDPIGEWRCGCRLKFGFSDSAIAHQSAVLAPILAEHTERAVREALEAAAVRVEDLRASLPESKGQVTSRRSILTKAARLDREGGQP